MKEIKKIYLVYFFAGLSNAAAVTYTLYFLSHGLSQFQIGQLFGFFMICLAIFDIPTGGIADMFGHKLSVGIGLFLQAISFLLLFLFPFFGGFLLGMFCNALGIAFQSGANTSLIYELLRKENLHESFQKIFGKANGYFLIASLISTPLGALIYKFYPRIPYLLAGVFFFFATFTVFFVQWEFKRKPPKFISYVKTIQSGIHLTIKNRVLMATVIIGIGLTVIRMVFNQNINQPYLISVGVDVGYIGVIAAIASAVQAGISIHAHRLSQWLGKRFSLLLIIIIPALSVITLSFINTLLAIPIIFIFYMGQTFRDTVMTHIGQEEVHPDKRSTMASTVSFLVSVSVGILLPYWGKGVDAFGLHNILFLLGIFALVLGTIGLFLFESKKH